MDHKLNLELFKNLPEKQYDELKNDIKNRGIQDPLHIRKIEDGFQVICGHQRKLVAIDLKLKSVPCIVRDDLVEEWQVEEQLIRDNLNRRHLSDPEIARVSSRLLLIEKDKAKIRQKATQLKGKDKTGKPIVGGGKISTTEKKNTGGKFTTSDKGKSRDVVAHQFGQVQDVIVPL